MLRTWRKIHGPVYGYHSPRPDDNFSYYLSFFFFFFAQMIQCRLLLSGRCDSSEYLHDMVYKSRIWLSQLAFYVNLHWAIIGPSATLTGGWRPDIDLRRMLTGFVYSIRLDLCKLWVYYACSSVYSLVNMCPQSFQTDRINRFEANRKISWPYITKKKTMGILLTSPSVRPSVCSSRNLLLNHWADFY